MRHEQPTPTKPGSSAGSESSLPFITDSHLVALDKLGQAYMDARPLAVLTGEWKFGASFLINRFLNGVTGDVSVVHITEPCFDALTGMRLIIQKIGFQPKEMGPVDLEQVLTMFLSTQKTQHRRTIICMEQAQDSGHWLLDGVRRLIELETKNNYGLMIILSGQPRLNDLLNKPPLDAIFAQFGQRISLAPFTSDETTEFIRWQIKSAGTANIGQVFEFNAMNVIHELCAGVPDTIDKLYRKSRELAKEENTAPVTSDLVERAGKLLGLMSKVRSSDAETGIMEMNKPVLETGRLVARLDGNVLHDQPLNRERILIGRDDLCDIQIPGHLVSRHHAVVISSSSGANLMDLGSTNGTFVDGRRIEQCNLLNNQVIAIGDCRIEYTAANQQEVWSGDMVAVNRFEQGEADSRVSDEGEADSRVSDEGKTDDDVQLLELEPAKNSMSSRNRNTRK